MGVDPKKWGPSAWVTIHSLSAMLDDINDEERKKIISDKFWTLLPYILPCVICRQSAKKFVLLIKNRHPENNKKFAYMLHEEVNIKLLLQKYKYAADIKYKLNEFQPDFEEVVYEHIRSETLFQYMFNFLYYIVIDLDLDRLDYVNTFIYFLSFIFSDPTNHIFYQSLRKVGILKKFANIIDRITYVHKLEKEIMSKLNFKQPFTSNQRLQLMF